MAYWIHGKDYEVRCSNCHNKFIQMKTSKYCPYCKAEMENAWAFFEAPNNRPMKKKK